MAQSVERSCTMLVHFDKPASASEIKESLEGNDPVAKVQAMQRAIMMLLNGEQIPALFITIIRYVLPSEDHTIQKLLLLYLVSPIFICGVAMKERPQPGCALEASSEPMQHVHAGDHREDGRQWEAATRDGKPFHHFPVLLSATQQTVLSVYIVAIWKVQIPPCCTCMRADLPAPPLQILICQNLRNNLQHPNEYIRGVTLRFLCRIREEEILEPLIPSILACLEHRHSYVRRNAVLAINALYKLPKGELLLVDAPELIEKVGFCCLHGTLPRAHHMHASLLVAQALPPACICFVNLVH